MDVDAIEERTGNLVEIALGFDGGAATTFGSGWRRIHRGDKHEVARKSHRSRGSGD